MARDLGDVLHYFLGSEDAPPGDLSGGVSPVPATNGPQRPAALPIVALPIGDRDVVRAAFAWNLAVEVARQGASATLVAPEEEDPSPVWPASGRGPVGAEVVTVPARGLGDLFRAALDVAVPKAADALDGGVVLVRVPPAWLRHPADGAALLRWSLLLTSSDPGDLLETYGLAKRLFKIDPEARVGVTVHGVRRVAEAERAFGRVSRVAAERLGQRMVSYGLLVDDLHVYRAIVSRRPVGLAHPQSRAARAVHDVARLVLDDAREAAGV